MSTKNDPLVTYLHDHLAGAKHAIELTQAMQKEFKGQPLGAFAASILIEIKKDKDTLENIVKRVGTGSSQLKELSSWFVEKVARLKMGPDAGDRLGTFEALEFLELGIHGKWGLWRVLSNIAPYDTRLQGIDYEDLAARAESQRSSVDRLRQEWARLAFGSNERSQKASA